MRTCASSSSSKPIGSTPSRSIPERKKKRIDGLSRGDRVTGRVVQVLEDVLRININTSVVALLHVEELGSEKERFRDFKKGQQLVARIKEVDVNRGRIHLTLRNDGYVEWRRIKLRHVREGKVYPGVVKKLVAVEGKDGWLRVGEAFVDIGAQKDAHLSSAEGVPGVGSKVKVRILAGGNDPEYVRIRRRVEAELVTEEESAKETEEFSSKKSLSNPVTAEEEEEEEDELDKYAYLDDIY